MTRNQGQAVSSNQGHGIELKKHVERYARIPDSVLFDSDLTPSAIRVYAFLSRRVWQGTTTSVGIRLIAAKLKTGRSVVSEAVSRLAGKGHITITAHGKQRTLYALNSTVFGQKQGKEDVIISSPSGGKRLASVAKTA